MTEARDVDAYLAKLRVLTQHIDPVAGTASAEAIRRAGDSLDELQEVRRDLLATWVKDNARDANVLGLTVGLSQEKLKNYLAARFGSSSWAKVASEQPEDLIAWFDAEFNLMESLEMQRARSYSFGDILVARGSSRQVASRAGLAGKLIEDAVEAIVRDDLDLPYQMRGRFVGRNGDTGPADVAIPNFERAKITIACKGFDSTGSKLTAAVDEVRLMAEVSYADQYVFAVVDGIGWNQRKGDFRRLFALAQDRRIDGLYALADLATFRSDLENAALRAGPF